MTDLLVGYATSNLLLSVAVAVVALLVQRRGRYPALAHLLWVLVLVKAITPPLLVVPVSLESAGAAVGAAITRPLGLGAAGTASGVHGVSVGSLVTLLVEHGVAVLLLGWLLGSVVVFLVSTGRIRRFGRLLGQVSTVAPPEIQDVGTTVAREFGLRSAPTIYLCSARLSPMTWWSARRLRVVLPEAVLGEVDGDQLRWIIAHEFAHIKRRDHLVRWVEWLACVSFWWNPVVWLAHRNLRLTEEDACDELVLQRMEGQPRSYARTLLTVVEILAHPALRAPSVATGIGTTNSLEHRFSRIISPVRNKEAPRRLVLGITIAALVLMVAGVGAIDDEVARAGWPGETRAAADGLGSGDSIVTPPVEVTWARLSATLAADPRANDQDVFIGTAAADAYFGSGRDETIVGRAGADELDGGAGRDVIHGGKGADIIRGGKGADTITGDAGRDTLKGGAGKDTIRGGGGRDIIDGGKGHDTIEAGAGDDLVRSWQDGVADYIDCGSGDGDRAVVDSTDTTRRCEEIVVRDRP